MKGLFKGLTFEHLRRPQTYAARQPFFPARRLKQFDPCCDEVIEIPRVGTYYSEIHPDYTFRSAALGLSLFMEFYDYPYDRELARIVRALIGSHYYLSEIVVYYLLPEEGIDLLSPLFGAYGCPHYDTMDFSFSCSVDYGKDYKPFAYNKQLLPTIHYSRPMLRHAALVFTLSNQLVARYEHYKMVVGAVTSSSILLAKSLEVINNANKEDGWWLYKRDMSLDARLRFFATQAPFLMRYRRAWDNIYRLCEWPEKEARSSWYDYDTKARFKTSSFVSSVSGDRVSISGDYIVSVITGCLFGAPQSGHDGGRSSLVQNRYGGFPEYCTTYYHDNVFLNDEDMAYLNNSVAVIQWAGHHRIIPESPSYSPTLPSFSPVDLRCMASEAVHDQKEETKAPARAEDEGEVIFQRQLEQARQLSLQDQEDLAHVVEEQKIKKKIFVELSETETEEDEPILAQSQSLDPDPEFAHLFCHETVPIDSDDEPLVSPKTSDRIQKVKMLRMVNEWHGEGTPPTPKGSLRKVRKRVSGASLGELCGTDEERRSQREIWGTDNKRILGGHFIVRMSDL